MADIIPTTPDMMDMETLKGLYEKIKHVGPKKKYIARKTNKYIPRRLDFDDHILQRPVPEEYVDNDL